MKQYLIGFLLGIALIGGIWWGKSCNVNKAIRNNAKKEITTSDTFTKRTYTPPTPIANATSKKPEVVIQYIDRPVLLKDLTYEVLEDTLKFRHKTKDTFIVKIPVLPLALFPKSPRLIYGKFSHDSIRMDIMKTSGELFTYQYTPDFLNKKYEFVEGEMKISDNPNKLVPNTPAKPKKLYTESNLWVSGSPINKNLRFSLDYSAMFKRVGIFGAIEFNTKSIPQTQINGGLRIKLK